MKPGVHIPGGASQHRCCRHPRDDAAPPCHPARPPARRADPPRLDPRSRPAFASPTAQVQSCYPPLQRAWSQRRSPSHDCLWPRKVADIPAIYAGGVPPGLRLPGPAGHPASPRATSASSTPCRPWPSTGRSAAKPPPQVAYSDRPVAVPPGLSSDIVPIALQVAKLALPELLSETATTLESLNDDLVAPL